MYINERTAIRDALMGGLRNQDKSLLEKKIHSEDTQDPVDKPYPCGKYECPIVNY